jgi:hypothetical protein
VFDEYGRATFATVIARELSRSMTASCEASITVPAHLIEMARSPTALNNRYRRIKCSGAINLREPESTSRWKSPHPRTPRGISFRRDNDL